MAGHDLAVNAPVYVSLEIAMKVCVQQGYLASHVQQALMDAVSNRILPDGTPGYFYADNWTFGQTVYLSPLYALVQSTPGVASVTVTCFRRQGQASTEAVNIGELAMDRLEIPRLDNDPNYPEHGRLTLCMFGGQ